MTDRKNPGMAICITVVLVLVLASHRVRAVSATDDQPGRPDVGREGVDPGAEQVPRVERRKALLYFEDLVFGGQGPEFVVAAKNRLDGVLRQKIFVIDLICGLTGEQKEKLQLAGRGDVIRFFGRIDRRLKEMQLIDNVDARAQLGEVNQEARRLRESMWRGPFNDGSLFAKTVKNCLTVNQAEQFDAFFRIQQEAVHELSRLGDQVQVQTQFGWMDEIVEIRLASTPIVDQDLSILAKLKSLTGLSLGSTPITNAGLFHLTKLKRLETLDLANTKIDSAGLLHLKEFQFLRILDLSGTPITDDGLLEIATLTKLERLSLPQTLITDAGLMHLKELTNLSYLNLEGIQMTDTGLQCIKGLTNLRVLRLANKSLSDSGLSHLADLKNLQELLINESRATEAGMAKLEKALPELNRLQWIRDR